MSGGAKRARTADLPLARFVPYFLRYLETPVSCQYFSLPADARASRGLFQVQAKVQILREPLGSLTALIVGDVGIDASRNARVLTDDGGDHFRGDASTPSKADEGMAVVMEADVWEARTFDQATIAAACVVRVQKPTCLARKDEGTLARLPVVLEHIPCAGQEIEDPVPALIFGRAKDELIVDDPESLPDGEAFAVVIVPGEAQRLTNANTLEEEHVEEWIEPVRAGVLEKGIYLLRGPGLPFARRLALWDVHQRRVTVDETVLECLIKSCFEVVVDVAANRDTETLLEQVQIEAAHVRTGEVTKALGAEGVRDFSAVVSMRFTGLGPDVLRA